MATALLVEFDPDKYHSHMQKWAHWLNNIQDAGHGQGGGGSNMHRMGFYKGGKENIVRKKPYTARGQQSQTGAPRNFCPEGFDTEQAIDKAVKALHKGQPDVARAVSAQFLWAGGRDEKAAELGISVHAYKQKTKLAQSFIIGFMGGTKYRQAG